MLPAPAVLRLIPWQRFPAKTLFVQEPQLRRIWSPELSEIAASHTQAWETSWDESGVVYLACRGAEVVGIGGWYQMSDTLAGLRWFGLVPELRGQGLARAMLAQLLAVLPATIDSVLEVTRNPASKAFFVRCGFEVVTNPEEIRAAVRAAEYDIAEGGWVLRAPIFKKM